MPYFYFGAPETSKEKNMRQTTMLKSAEVKKDWYVVDASGKTLGRLATQCAAILRGKHKPTYTPNVDCGDYVIITNAAKIVYTGDQENKKIYYHHSDRKSTRLNSSHPTTSRMPSSA